MGASAFLENLAKGEPFADTSALVAPKLSEIIVKLLGSLGTAKDLQDKGFLDTANKISLGASAFLENLAKGEPFADTSALVAPKLSEIIVKLLGSLGTVKDLEDKAFLDTADKIAVGSMTFLENLAKGEPFIKTASLGIVATVDGIIYLIKGLSSVKDLQDKGFLDTANKISLGASTFLENLAKGEPFAEKAALVVPKLSEIIVNLLGSLGTAKDLQDTAFLDTANKISLGSAVFLENLAKSEPFAEKAGLIVPKLAAVIVNLLGSLKTVKDLQDISFLATADKISSGSASFLENLAKGEPFVVSSQAGLTATVDGIIYLIKGLSEVKDIKDKEFLDTANRISLGSSTFLENLAKGEPFVEKAGLVVPKLSGVIVNLLSSLDKVKDLEDKNFYRTATEIAASSASFLENLAKGEPFSKTAGAVTTAVIDNIVYIIKGLQGVSDLNDKQFLATVNQISLASSNILESLSKGKPYIDDAKVGAAGLVEVINYLLGDSTVGNSLRNVKDLEEKGFLSTVDQIAKLAEGLLINLGKSEPFIEPARASIQGYLEVLLKIEEFFNFLNERVDPLSEKVKNATIKLNEVAGGLSVLSESLKNVVVPQDISTNLNDLIGISEKTLKSLSDISTIGGAAKKGAASVAEVVTILLNDLSKAAEKIDPEKLKETVSLIKVLSEGASSFMKGMALSVILGPPAILGTIFFGKTIKSLISVLSDTGTISKEQQKGIENIMNIAQGAASFMKGMALSLLIGPFAMLGVIFFGNTVKTLTLILSEAAAGDKDQKEGLEAIQKLVDGSLKFGKDMIKYIFISPLAMLGALLFGRTVNVLISSISTVGKENLEGTQTLMKIAEGARAFMKELAGLAMYGIAANKGADAFVKVVKTLAENVQKTTEGVDVTSIEDKIKTLVALSENSRTFMVNMAATAILGIPAMIGAVAFGFTYRILAKILSNAATIGKETQEGLSTVLGMAKGALLFGLGMSLWAVVGPVAAVGALMFGIVVVGLTEILSRSAAVEEKTTKGIEAILNMAKGAAMFGLAMILYGLAAQQIAIGALTFITVVGGMLLVFGALGKFGEKGMKSASETLDKMKYSAAILAVTFILIGLVAVPFATGALVFTVVVGAMLLVYGALATFFPAMIVAARTIDRMAKGTALLALTFFLVSLVAKQVAVGALVTALSIGLLLTVMGFVSSQFTGLMKAANALERVRKPVMMLMATFALVGFVADKAAIGALVSALSIALLGGALFLLGKMDSKKDVTKGINLLKRMDAKLLAPFLIVMALAGAAASLIAIGTLVTGLSIVFIGGAFALLGVMDRKKDITEGVKVMKKMQVALMPFMLVIAATVLVGLVWKEAAMGAIVIAGTIVLIGGAFTLLGVMDRKNDITEGVKVMKKITTAMMPFFLVIAASVLVGMAWKETAIGAAVIAGTIIVIGGAFALLGVMDRKNDITSGTKTMMKMVPALVGFLPVILVSTLVGMVWEAALKGVGVMAAAIVGLGGATYLLGKMNERGDVTKGATTLIALGGGLVIFSVALLILSTIKDWGSVGIGLGVTAAAIVGLGLAAYALGIPAVYPFAMLGVGVLIALGAALIVFSVALLVLSKVSLSKEWTDNMSYTIKELGSAVMWTGLKSPLIALGAAAMIIMAPALLLLSIGLLAFKATKFEAKDAENLRAAISGVFAGFDSTSLVSAATGIVKAGAMVVMAGSIIVMSMGIALFKATKFDAKDAANLQSAITAIFAGFDSIGLVAATSAAAKGVIMMGLSASIAAMTWGISAFKKLGYTEQDGELMKSAIKSIVGAYSEAFADIGPVKMAQMWSGAELLGKLASGIAALAEGVARMADLEVVDYEVINAGTKNAKIVPKGVRKLRPTDFAKAGEGVAAILSAITTPLSEFGRAVEEGKGDGLFSLFNTGYIEKGLNLFSKLTDSLTGLAEGVARMANLEVITMSVYKPGTADAKLVPSGVRKLKPADFVMAGINVGLILSALTQPMIDFGSNMTKGEGLFSGGFIEKGLEGLSKVSTSLVNLAEGVAKMANLEVSSMELINPGTKNAKLVPGKPRKLTPGDFKNAGTSVGKILTALTNPLIQFGKAMEGGASDGLFGFGGEVGYIEKGIEGLASLTKPLTSLADLIVKLGSGNFVEQQVVTDPKTKKPILVPGKVLKISDVIKNAKSTLKDILAFVPDQFKTFGEKWEKMKGPVESGISGFEVITKGMGMISEITKSYFNATQKVMEARKLYKNLEVLESKKQYPFLIPALQLIDAATVMEPSKAVLTTFKPLLENTIKPMMELFSEVAASYSSIIKDLKLEADKRGNVEFVMLTFADHVIEASKAFAGQEGILKTGNAVLGTAIKPFLTTMVSVSDIFSKVINNLESVMSSKVNVVGILENIIQQVKLTGKSDINGESAIKNIASVKNFVNQLIPIGTYYSEAISAFKEVSDTKVNVLKMLKNILEQVKLVSTSSTIAVTAVTSLLKIKEFYKIMQSVGTDYANVIKIFSEIPKISMDPADMLGRSINKIAQLSDTTKKSLEVIKKADVLMKIFVGVGQRYEFGTRYFDVIKKRGVNPEEMLLSFSKGLNVTGDTFTNKMAKKQLDHFTTFNNQILRLSGAVSPFERFVKAFGEMSKHMKVFADNFSVMTPDGISAFKEWTDSMVQISKVDITKSEGITKFVNDATSAAFAAGGSPKVPASKPAQQYTVADKKAQVAAQVGTSAGGAGAPGKQQAAGPAQTVKIDTAALASAISTALRNITVENLKVTGKFEGGR